MFQERWVRRAAAALLVLAFAIQCAFFVRANSQIYDEGITLASGVLLLRGGPEVNGEHPPLARLLAALPIQWLENPRIDLEEWGRRQESGFGLGRMFMHEGGVPHERLLVLGRAPMVLLAIALVAVVGLFATRLWGPRAGLLALALVAFDPNLVAHGSLASHDAPLALFTLLTFFAVSEFFARPRTNMLVLAGLALGCALATKFSGLVVVLAVGLAFLLQALGEGGIAAVWIAPQDAPRTKIEAAGRAAGNLVLVFGAALLVVRLIYGARGFGPYFEGVSAQMAHQRHGHPAFFFGELGSKGWPAYFPVTVLFKSPPLSLALALASMFLVKRGAAFGRAWLFLVLPSVLLLGVLVFSHVALGIRYALPIVPLLAVVGSRVATFELPRAALVAVGLGLLHHVTAAVRIAPHDIAFFSDAIGGPNIGRRYLSDSNVDWGQDLPALSAWARQERPAELLVSYFGTASVDAYGIRHRPAPNSCPHPAPAVTSPPDPQGRGVFLAVSALNAHGVFFFDRAAYQWLDAREPVARLGHSIYVYEITRDAPAWRKLADLYARVGNGEEARWARSRADAIAPPAEQR